MNYRAKAKSSVTVDNNNLYNQGTKPSLFEEVSLNSIRAHLTKPSFGMFLFLVGFNGIYFLPLIFPQSLFSGATSGSYRYLFLSWILISFGGLLETLSSNLWLSRRKPVWLAISVAALVLLALRGFFDGEALYSIVQKTSPLLWMLLLPAIGLRKRNWSWLWLTFLIQALIGVTYSLNIIFIENVNSRWEIFRFEGQNFLTLAIYMGMFLILFLPMMRGRFLIATVVGIFITELLVDYFLASRLSLLLLPIEILLVIFIYARARKGGILLIRLTSVLILVSVLFLSFSVVSLGSDLSPTFNEAYDGLLDRVYEQGSVVNTLRGNERWYEAKVVIATMNEWDWIAGKGLAARWQDSGFAEGNVRDMVHNTWLNAFYWGGILLFLMITIPALWAIRTLIKSRSIVALCFAAYMILIYMKFPFFMTTLITPEWILFCLAIGVCIEYGKKQPGRLS